MIGRAILEYVGSQRDMWSLIIYCLAVIVGLFLIWIYDPKAEKLTEEEQVAKRKRERYKQSSLLAVLGLSRDDFLHFKSVEDHFQSFQDVSRACRRAGLEYVSLVIGVDFTASNEWQGRKTFNGNCLHRIYSGRVYNPYQKVISILGQALEPFHTKNNIVPYGFGDHITKDRDIFPFNEDENARCENTSDVLDLYNDVAKRVTLSGPTSFAPLIRKTIEIAKRANTYHILIIIADGQVTEEQPTIDAILDASHYPISIIVVGVGDGPWDVMEEFDNHLPKRKFDNFQFVDYHNVTCKAKNPDATFALHALMEIPDQFKMIKSLGYLPEKKEIGKETNV
ncbi:uncharacterized protein LOC141898275 [Tubulanus polymorphus]|uniref:uncharacterized protein LOC141898275 n=1 Tax=Tubulanus polymorphus TaxID=672921 RepID=UPI003DA6951B